jgi:hypothetical protein
MNGEQGKVRPACLKTECQLPPRPSTSLVSGVWCWGCSEAADVTATLGAVMLHEC